MELRGSATYKVKPRRVAASERGSERVSNSRPALDGRSLGVYCFRPSMPKFFIKTYGCQMNERDSEQVAHSLMQRGYERVAQEADADVVLLNTCSVRDMAEQKALGKMAALAGQARKERPGQVLGFLGCMAQSRGRELIDR